MITLACPCLHEHIVSPSTFSLLEKVETSVRGEKSVPLQKLAELRCPLPYADKRRRRPYENFFGAGPYGSWLIDLKRPYAEIESGLLALRASRQMQQVESTSLKVTLTYRDGAAKLTLMQSLRRNAIGAEESATVETLFLEFNRDFGSGAYMTHRMNNGLFVDLLGFILQVF